MVFYDDFLTGCKNTLFSFLMSRTYVIFNKFATEKNYNYEKKPDPHTFFGSDGIGINMFM